MERLEAALEKAREQRQAAKPAAPVAAPEQPAPILLTSEATWQKLFEIKISARVARNNRITTLTNNALSGPYDMLRARAVRIMGENNWKRLAITSPNLACGKTTVAANLAISLARQPEIRVLVFDMDMRRPALNKILGHRGRYSLHDVLAQKADIEDQLVRYGDNLAFGLNYSAVRNPAELLQSNRTKEFLDEVERKYLPDFVIFDMPPMLASDDNVGFLQNVDCGLLVGAAEDTTISQLDSCEKELSELTNVLGVVLNKCRYTGSDSSYNYDYY